MEVDLILLFLALACFLGAAVGAVQKINLQALGLFFLTLYMAVNVLQRAT